MEHARKALKIGVFRALKEAIAQNREWRISEAIARITSLEGCRDTIPSKKTLTPKEASEHVLDFAGECLAAGCHDRKTWFLAVYGPKDADRAVEHYWDIVERTTKLEEGAIEAITGLGQAGLRVGVLTDTDGLWRDKYCRIRTKRERVRRSVPVSVLPARYLFVCRDDAALLHSKTIPETYREVCRQMGVAPDRTIMIGDKYEADIWPALQAGLVAKLKRRKDRPTTCDDAVPLLHSFRDILDSPQLSELERQDYESSRARYSETLALFRKKLVGFVTLSGVLLGAYQYFSEKGCSPHLICIALSGIFSSVFSFLSLRRTYLYHYLHKKRLALLDAERSTARHICDTFRRERHPDFLSSVWVPSGFYPEFAVPVLVFAVWVILAFSSR